MAGRWNSQLHPRDHRGRFTKKAGGSVSKSSNKGPGQKTASLERASSSKAVAILSPPLGGSGRGFDPTAGNVGKGLTVGPGKVSARVGLRSATVAYSRSVRVSPGVRVHGAVLARVERTSNKQGVIARITNKILLKLARALPNRLATHAEQMIRERTAQIGATKVALSGGNAFNPTVRASRATGRRQAVSGAKVRRVRNRKPRTRSIQGRRVK